jgi:uncharacterized membrane protein
MLNTVFAIALVVAVSSVGYAIVEREAGARYTELYLLTETEGGELVANNYPTEYVRGESRSIVVGIRNHEREQVRYTTVVELQRVADQRVVKRYVSAGS